jgi:hypothetical protein
MSSRSTEDLTLPMGSGLTPVSVLSFGGRSTAEWLSLPGLRLPLW